MYKLLKIYEKRIVGSILLLFISLNFIVWSEVFIFEKKAEMSVLFFDVGQGDAIFMESKDGTQVLIDGGPPNNILQNLQSSMGFFDKYIDVVIVTHPHADHISGLIEVLKRYDVGAVLESGVDYHAAEAKEFESLVKTKHIKKFIIDASNILSFFDGASIKFLHPDRSYQGHTLKNVHDSAVVGLFTYKGKTILLMSDAEKKLEEKLKKIGVLADIDVLKVGHHGSKTSTTQAFLNIIKPEYVVISVGARNRYGHPHPDVLSRLASSGANIFRTDTDGTIKLKINNGLLTLEAENSIRVQR